MFDRAVSSVIAVAAACAAVATAVVAAGFALYALLEHALGPAGAAATVAAVAALCVALYALVAHHRAKEVERKAKDAHAELLGAIPHALGDLTRDHPIAALAVSLVGGALVVRHPQLSRDLVSILAAVSSHRRS